jgi:hypothetical protein
MNGRVAVLKAYGGDFELREYPVPDPEPGAVLIRLTRAGVCGSDLRFPYERLVSHVFPLARIGEAFLQADWMQRDRGGLRISRAALSMVD